MLEWVVIGGQRCGTTALYEILKHHPRLHIPREKEAPLLHLPGVDESTYRSFYSSAFRHARPGALKGTITPQYSTGTVAVAQLREYAPAVRIILLTRDPIARSYSHYWLSVARHLERRSFEEAVAAQLTPNGQQVALHSHNETDMYVAWSEFGRILEMYARHFDSSQLLVCNSDELLRTPAILIPRILDHIGVPADDSLSQHYSTRANASVTRSRAATAEALLRASSLTTAIWRRLPEQLRRHVAYRVDHWGRSRQADPVPPLDRHLGTHLRQRLGEHFEADRERIPPNYAEIRVSSAT